MFFISGASKIQSGKCFGRSRRLLADNLTHKISNAPKKEDNLMHKGCLLLVRYVLCSFLSAIWFVVEQNNAVIHSCCGF